MQYYLSLTVFTFIAGITPGPNNLMLMASGLNHGIRSSLPHYLGICIGFPLMVAVIGFGFGTMYSLLPTLYIYIKIAGVTYLLFLAWKIAHAGDPSAAERTREPLSFIQAVAFQWLNPKGWTITIGALAAFTNENDVNMSILKVIIVYFLMGFLCMGLWLKLGHSLRNIISSGKRITIFNYTMAGLLALSVIPMALTGIELKPN